MKYVITVLIIIYGFMATSAIHSVSLPPGPKAAVTAPPAAPVKTGIFPIVRLHLMDGAFICSAAVVSDRLLVTAAHCVSEMLPGDTMEIRTVNGRKTGVFVQLAGINERADYAIMRGDFRKFEHLKIATAPQEILFQITRNSRQIIACGFAWSGDLFCSPVTNRHMMNFQIAGEGFLYPGMSGGPVIDVATSTIIGVNSNVQGPMIAFSPTVEIFRGCNVKPE